MSPSIPTISQVAVAAGVSRSTVSRAFTRPELLSADTVARVRAASARLGYVPNQVARALSTGRHGNIAIIVPDVANPFFPPLIRAAQKRAQLDDICVFLGDTDEDPAEEERLVTRFAGQVEGLVLVSSRLTEEQIQAHAQRRRLLLINREIADIPRILIDSSRGVREAVRHLAALGHRRVAYLSGPVTSWSNRQRKTAMREEARIRDIETVVLPPHKSTHESGRGAAGIVLKSGVTAAIAFDDLLAQGLLAGLAEEGISVPRDFSVIGCDDVLGATTVPPLTTVSNRCVEAGQLAVSLLLDILRSSAVSDVRYVLDTHLVLRATTAPPRSREASQGRGGRRGG